MGRGAVLVLLPFGPVVAKYGSRVWAMEVHIGVGLGVRRSGFRNT